MRRRDFITVMGGAVAGWPLAARAQQPTGKTARIGYLNFRSPVSTDEAFLQGLRELGWIEGQNIFIERRYAPVAFAAYWMNSDMLAAGKCGGFGKDATTCWQENRASLWSLPKIPPEGETQMAYSLYDAAVTPCAQQLSALAGIIDKAAAHCAANKIEESALLQDRLYPDMFCLA